MNVNFTFQQGNKCYTVIAEQVLFVEGQYKVYFNNLTITCKGKIVNAYPTQREQTIEKGFRYTLQSMK